MSLSVLNTQSNSASASSTVYRYSLFLFGGGLQSCIYAFMDER
jgi:hypothetical protein